MVVEFPDDVKPFQRPDGKWDAVDENGYGHSLGLDSELEVDIWIWGYEVGARENM